MLGALPALAVSEWQEVRHSRERAEAALVDVRAVLVGKLQLLEIAHSNNVVLVDRVAVETAELSQDDRFLQAPIDLRVMTGPGS